MPSFMYSARHYTIAGPPDDHVTNVIERSGTFYELDLLEALRERLGTSGGGLAVDTGAHIGNHSLYFACELRMGVLALEPNPVTHAFLVRNVGAHPIVPLPLAAGGEDPCWVRVVDGPPGNTGMASISRNPGELHRVLQVPLSCLVPEWSTVRLIKIDTEGSELDALAGAAAILQYAHPLLALEARTPEELAEQTAYLARFGYKHGERYCATPTYIWECP